MAQARDKVDPSEPQEWFYQCKKCFEILPNGEAVKLHMWYNEDCFREFDNPREILRQLDRQNEMNADELERLNRKLERKNRELEMLIAYLKQEGKNDQNNH